MTVSSEDLEYWRQWVGRRSTRTDMIDRSIIQRYAAAIGEFWTEGDPLPSMAHFTFFADTPQPDELGPDGHPKRGGSMPPITLPRRVAGANETFFHRDLTVGIPATRTSEIASLTHKKGRSGDLVLVETKTDIEQEGALCVSAKHTSIYRGEASSVAPAPDAAEPVPPELKEIWDPSPVDLFRFSAATFISHRIHYDHPYATGVEGYPGLLVHGPFTAAKLLGLARRSFGAVSRFSYRAHAPIFAGERVCLGFGDGGRQSIACREDGKVVMTADFDLRS